eukprot:2557923-Rhodomonas_salina.3
MQKAVQKSINQLEEEYHTLYQQVFLEEDAQDVCAMHKIDEIEGDIWAQKQFLEKLNNRLFECM